MNRKLKVVDGTGHGKLAPSPHRGLIKAIYDTIEACGGADLKQIKKYLPAAIDNSSQIASTKKIEKALYACVYRGYLVHNPQNDYWAIAPLSYYKTRQEVLKDLKDHPKRSGILQPRFPFEADRPRFFSHEQWHSVIAIAAVAFILGFVVGMAVQVVL